MIKIDNVVLPSPAQWNSIIMGLRNPKNSWDRSDSFEDTDGTYLIGEKDETLMMNLAKGGPVHAKYRRMIPVYLDITRPLYWWKEFDTYKIGTVANSCSTMHKIHAKEFEESDFSFEHVCTLPGEVMLYGDVYESPYHYGSVITHTINALNAARDGYLKTKDKKYWWQMIQLLPSSYNQKRTVMLNYEVLVNIYNSRRGHNLDEWHDFCKWIEGLPYAELITGGKHEN